MASQICLSYVCLSVTFVHPTQRVDLFDNIFAPYIAQGLGQFVSNFGNKLKGFYVNDVMVQVKWKGI